MSSYIVDYETINKVISGLQQIKSNFLNGKNGTILGKEMLAMNIQAVGKDYGKDAYENCDFKFDDYKFKPQLISKVQAYKALQCYLYQCDKMYNSDLYNSLKSEAISLANLIINDLESYRAARWG